ncbi:MAG TPA: CPBP family intramembrane glutamic endopeptidase [Symbiobacteriaceae bacterium]|jgi:membrane protease YdiL (CAAX protease family)|nr:CPBP family intramembrane glutamic endopeptidase [Symbiobacteriaceae bacterium]
MIAWLMKNPTATFLLLFVIRMLTALPTLKALLALGFNEPAAKMLSQVPTVVLVLGLVGWFGWWQQVGLTDSRWWNRPLDLVMLALYCLMPFAALPFVGVHSTAALEAVPLLLVDALCVAVWEEVFFRGLFLEQLRSRTPRYAVLIAAVVFGLAHATNVLAGASLWFALAQALWTFLCAFGLTAARLRTGSVWPLIISHFVLDGTERILANGQAMQAPVPALVAMVLVALAFGVYGVVAVRRTEGRSQAA